MKESSKLLLEQLSDLLAELNEHSYSADLSVLNGNSIGKHVRHILDLFDCLILGSETGLIEYDNRRRAIEIEVSNEIAQEKIVSIISMIQDLDLNRLVTLKQKLANESLEIQTQLQRELLYNIEHTIHHLAIIRIGIEQNFPEISLPKNFGIAYSTIQHCEQQA
jgi:uncharacterized damage-inducible protein DinB